MLYYKILITYEKRKEQAGAPTRSDGASRCERTDSCSGGSLEMADRVSERQNAVWGLFDERVGGGARDLLYGAGCAEVF